MKSFEEIVQILKARFSKSFLEVYPDGKFEPYLTIPPDEIDIICFFLFTNSELIFDSLINLSAVDDFNGELIKDKLGNQSMQGGTISVYYHLESIKFKHKLLLKVITERDNPIINSVTSIWKSANWHEREAYDLFGIIFKNHPDLRRILMPYDWEFGHPLKKDYQNPEFYQGMKVPY
jgi:NADH-quinone oxidoreductase subunit C